MSSHANNGWEFSRLLRQPHFRSERYECEFLSLLPTPTMWLPCGSFELHWDESAGPLERSGCFACRENGWGEMKEAGFE